MKIPSRRIFSTLAALIVTLGVAPSWSAQFGQTQGGSPSSGLSGDYKRGSKFTLSESGVLSALTARLDGLGGPQSGYQTASMAVYADAAGLPGVKLAESFPLTINAQTTEQEYVFSLRSVPLPAGDYWLVLHTDGAAGGSTPGIIRDLGTSGVNNWYGNADSFADGASSPFGTGNTGTVSLTLAGEYLQPSHASFAGRATVAATPSNGLASNFKRGSRFTMAEAGRMFALSAYLDGKGGGSGSQKLRYAIYRDSGGVPGTLVRESDEVTVKAGQAGSWVTAPLPLTDVPAGEYWVVIHTGDTGDIARDYGDGAANWYSNADAYTDGASTSFGSGTAGTVTISAAAMYIPGSWVTQTLGRTTVASTPSGGLSANYSRGSSFGATAQVQYPTEATAIWAYVDGNGGGSGSQQVRAVLYGFDGIATLPYGKMTESEPATIPAGMSARWVRFPFRGPVEISSTMSYLLMLHSGDNANVVRDYGDGDADWVGLPDAFSDGATRSFQRFGPHKDPSVTEGNVTLSIYLEFGVPAGSP